MSGYRAHWSAAALAAGMALAQGSAMAQETKLGIVSMAKIFDGYEKTKASDGALSRKGQQKEAEFQAKMAEIQKLREGLELLTGDAREAKARELEEKADALKRFRNNVARDLQRERSAIAQGLVKEIQAAVNEYAKANGFSLILDDRSILFSQGSVADVTGQVLQLLNGRYAGKKPAGG